jgi:hypothetical protein
MLLEPLVDKNSKVVAGSLVQPSNLSTEDTRLWAGVLAFQKVLERIAKQESKSITSKISEEVHKDVVNGTSEHNGEIVIMADDNATDPFNTGESVLTIFAHTQGAPKQLFSSFRTPVKVGDADEEGWKEFDDTVEVTLPLKETSLPNFVSITKIPAAIDGQVQKAKAPTFGERFAPPRSLAQVQPPKPSNKLLTKSSAVTWVSPETLTRQRNERAHADRTYNWSSTRLSTGSWLTYNGLDLPKEPASPEERRRQRDRALSTGAPQPTQSEEAILAAQKAKDDALFRSAFSSFAPSRDNSGAVVPDLIKNEFWWRRVGHQRAQRILGNSVQGSKDPQSEVDAQEEYKAFKDAVENIDPVLLELDPQCEKHEADKDTDDLLQDINDLLETLYSYQRIRKSHVSSNSNPMTPVGQRNALTEMVGTPSTPSSAENEVYNMLRTQLTLLILQLPPAAVSRLNGDRLEKLNISTDITVEVPDEAGTLEDDAPKQPPVSQIAHAQQPIASRGPVSGSYNPLQYNRTQQGVHTPSALGGGRSTSYYPQQQNQRTPSISYSRQASGVQSFGAGYSSSVTRPGFSQSLGQSGYNQSPGRVNYSQSSQYYQQVQQAAGKTGYGGYPSGTPHTNTSRFPPQTPGSYNRTPSGMQYAQGNAASAQSPHYPQGTSSGSPGQLNRSASGSSRPSYFQSQASTASGPTGFHTSMTAAEQQMLMDRQRAQFQAQNQARLAAAGQTTSLPSGNSVYTTPSREGSRTPRPLAAAPPPDQKIPMQTNGMS